MRLSRCWVLPPPLEWWANYVTPTWAGQTQPLAEAGWTQFLIWRLPSSLPVVLGRRISRPCKTSLCHRSARKQGDLAFSLTLYLLFCPPTIPMPQWCLEGSRYLQDCKQQVGQRIQLNQPQIVCLRHPRHFSFTYFLSNLSVATLLS